MRFWERLPMILGGNKAKYLLSFNHFTKTIYHHYHDLITANKLNFSLDSFSWKKLYFLEKSLQSPVIMLPWVLEFFHGFWSHSLCRCRSIADVVYKIHKFFYRNKSLILMVSRRPTLPIKSVCLLWLVSIWWL